MPTSPAAVVFDCGCGGFRAASGAKTTLLSLARAARPAAPGGVGGWGDEQVKRGQREVYHYYSTRSCSRGPSLEETLRSKEKVRKNIGFGIFTAARLS